MTAAIIIASLISSLLVETGVELAIEKYFLEDEPGAAAELTPGVPHQMVNLLPQATVSWKTR